MLGEKTMDQLEDDALFFQPDPESNSIAVIVHHLCGNMLSRWTDFLTTDGEKEWRERDNEFADVLKDRKTLLSKWNEGWNCLYNALNEINSSNFDQLVYIRNMGHTITEAINRQMCHYAYHVGQIVYIGKMVKQDAWDSLSIPKGGSEAYNKEKFDGGKRQEHFTGDFLNKTKKL